MTNTYSNGDRVQHVTTGEMGTVTTAADPGTVHNFVMWDSKPGEWVGQVELRPVADPNGYGNMIFTLMKMTEQAYAAKKDAEQHLTTKAEVLERVSQAYRDAIKLAAKG